MRKTLELLALSTCTAALCVTLTGCEAVKGAATSEKPVRTVSMESEICARSATKCTAKRWIVFMKVADMEDKTDNSQKKEEHDSLKPARDAIATAMRAAQFAKAIGTPLPKPLKWQREFYDATGVFPYGWYECPVCGYRTDWEPHACPICHTLLEP